MEQNLHNSVYVISCVWELFVLVGKAARADREVIRAALDLAKVIYYSMTHFCQDLNIAFPEIVNRNGFSQTLQTDYTCSCATIKTPD